MERRFRHSYEVRYDESNLYGFATPTAIFRYMQDIAGLDSQEVDLSEGGLWVARRTVIDFGKPIPARTSLELETYPLGFTRVTAQRGYFFYLKEAGNTSPVFSGRTLWVYLNPNGKPARIPESYIKAWLPDNPKKLVEEKPWPVFPEKTPFLFSSRVNFSDLDVMAHMNNTSYVEVLDNAAWKVFEELNLSLEPGKGFYSPLSYDIEYQVSAQLGDPLQVRSWFEPVAGVKTRFERFQLIYRQQELLARSRSRWEWVGLTGEAEAEPLLNKLWL